MLQRIFGNPWLNRLWRDRLAGVSVIAALALPVLVGSAGLAFDLNRGHEQRIVNQRAADMAALGAAMAYVAKKDTGLLVPSARDIVAANGVSGVTVAAALVPDVPVAGQSAVQVTVTRAVPFTLARALGFSGSFQVSAAAFASVTAEAPYAAPCYLALNAGASAITVTGGASIEAPGCAVAAVGTIKNNGKLIRGKEIISGSGSISVDYGTLTADALRYAGSVSKPAWNNAVPPADKWFKGATALVDPWAANGELQSAKALLGTFTALPTLSDPVTPAGSDWTFSSSPSAAVAGYRIGTTNEFTVPAGNYTIGKLSVAGGIRVTFASGSIITVRNGLKNGGDKLAFGNVDLSVNGGFETGSSGVQIGDGPLRIGSGTVSFTSTKNVKGDGDVTINQTLSLGGGSKLVMGRGRHLFGAFAIAGGSKALLGDGDFAAVRGVLVDGGGSELAIGNGAIAIGKDPGTGHAIRLAGSSVFIMGDGPFSADGNIDTQGNSRLIFGRAANHLINGNMLVRGGVQFGAGRYTINGNFINGTGGASAAYASTLTGKVYGEWLEGENVAGFDMAGIDVTFILKGVMNLAGGAKVKLEASNASVAGAQIGELLMASDSTAASTWTGGSGGAFAGTIHLPNSAVSMGGGNSTVSAGKCMTLIANTIQVSGGAATGTACTAMGGGGGAGATRIRLVR